MASTLACQSRKCVSIKFSLFKGNSFHLCNLEQNLYSRWSLLEYSWVRDLFKFLFLNFYHLSQVYGHILFEHKIGYFFYEGFEPHLIEFLRDHSYWFLGDYIWKFWNSFSETWVSWTYNITLTGFMFIILKSD